MRRAKYLYSFPKKLGGPGATSAGEPSLASSCLIDENLPPSEASGQSYDANGLGATATVLNVRTPIRSDSGTLDGVLVGRGQLWGRDGNVLSAEIGRDADATCEAWKRLLRAGSGQSSIRIGGLTTAPPPSSARLAAIDCLAAAESGLQEVDSVMPRRTATTTYMVS